MMHPVLSILVITHNQRELLKRCLSSVLGQKLNVPFEVIVSDDWSDDGTAEYIADLQNQITNGKLQISNLTQLVYTRCNSNDCDPKNVSERCGWNKLNAWRHAEGIYMVNIDADDYLRHDDIYQLQIDRLEAHPECSMCQQHVWRLDAGDSIEKGHVSYLPPMAKDGAVFTKEQVVTYNILGLNQSYMMRRQHKDDMAELYGKHFDDTIITLHHLQYGSVIFVDRADYVWVQYATSITKTLRGDDNVAEYGLLPLHHIRFIPAFAGMFMQDGLKDIIHMLKVFADKGYQWDLTERTQAAFEETPGRIYRVLAKPQSTFRDRLYLRYVRIVALMYGKYKWSNWEYLYGLLISREAAKKIFK